VLKYHSKLRRALQAAVNREPVLQSAIGPAELWKASGSFMPESTLWYSKAGLDRFSANNPELAKKLAKEAGYNGEKITLMASTSYKFHYDSTLVIVKQLQAAGFNIDHQIYDWATLISKQARRPGTVGYFLHPPRFCSRSHPVYIYERVLPRVVDNGNEEGPCRRIRRYPGRGKAQGSMGQDPGLVYDEVPVMQTGDHFTYDISSPKGQGLSASSLIWPKFWGVSFGK
jgi:peptide/nickel transport system substrate-binding protein